MLIFTVVCTTHMTQVIWNWESKLCHILPLYYFVFYFIDYTISKFCWSECTEARSSSLKDDKFQYCKFLFYNRYKEMFRVACFIFIQSNYLLRWTSNLKAENYVIGTDTCRVKSYRRNTENVIEIGLSNKVIHFRSLHCFGETGLNAGPHEYAMEELMISYPDFNNLFAFHYWIIALQQLDWLLTYSVR